MHVLDYRQFTKRHVLGFDPDNVTYNVYDSGIPDEIHRWLSLNICHKNTGILPAIFDLHHLRIKNDDQYINSLVAGVLSGHTNSIFNKPQFQLASDESQYPYDSLAANRMKNSDSPRETLQCRRWLCRH